MGCYVFRPNVFFVEGAFGGAIYDCNTGDVFWINPAGMETIVQQKGDETEFWQELVELEIVEEAVEWQPLPNIPKNPKPTLEFIWFEILGDDCNESCLHCYADSMPPTKRRELGLEVEETAPKRKLSFAEWCKLIEEGYQLGARSCQFIGGEPLLYHADGKECLDLVEHARNVGYQFIEIFTNGTLLTERRIQRVLELGVNIAISLYSSEAEVHDQITQTTGSFNRTMATLARLKELGIPTRVETVLMKQNQATIRQTIQLVDDMGFRHKSPDPIRPKGRGDKITLFPSLELVAEFGIITAPNFYASMKTIAHYSSSHSCLAGKITLTETGEVLPCIFSRTQSMGNVIHPGGLEAVINGQGTQVIWNTTKDQVLVCQDCEYRYVCFDCRPLSEGLAGGQSDYRHAPYPRCSYNPYTGEWAEGLWRMVDGKPYYERKFGPTIKEVAESGAVAAEMPSGH